MGLGRVTSFSLLTSICIQPTNKLMSSLPRAPLVLGQATNNSVLTRLTMARTRGKPPLSPMQYTIQLSTGATSKWLFVPRVPSGSPEILTTGFLATLRAYNFLCRPPIVMRSKEKLQPSSRIFQWNVAHCLHVRKSSLFLTFSGRESNCQCES